MRHTIFTRVLCLIAQKKKSSLNDLKIQERVAFLRDMSLVGDVLLKVCSCQRVNYDILGNTAHFLHTLLFPRYRLEDSEKVLKPVWLHDSSYWTNNRYQYDVSKHGKLRKAITKQINKIANKEK